MTLDTNFDIECPKCKKKFKQKLSNTSPGKSRNCPYCNQKITFSGDDMNKTLKNIEKSISNISEKFEIKL